MNNSKIVCDQWNPTNSLYRSRLTLEHTDSSHHVSLFLCEEKEQKTTFDKNGIRFFYYGQIEHDDYEKKKLGEFDKFLMEGKLDLNREFWNQQKILQFLSGNGYN